MKKFIVIIAMSTLTLASFAGENLISNGDFSKGSSRWKGDKKIEFETPDEKNRICKIELDDDDDRKFQQEIRTKGIKDLTVKYRIKKSKDYEGRGFEIRIIRDDGSYHYLNQSLPSNDQWIEKTVTFTDLRKSSKITVVFIVRSGDSGYISFDDIVATGK